MCNCGAPTSLVKIRAPLAEQLCHCAPLCWLQQVFVLQLPHLAGTWPKNLPWRAFVAILHIKLSNPLLHVAAAEHSGHFWKVSNCFSLTDQSTQFQDYDNPSPRDSTAYRCKLSDSLPKLLHSSLFQTIQQCQYSNIKYFLIFFEVPGGSRYQEKPHHSNRPTCGKRKRVTFWQGSSMKKIKQAVLRWAVTFLRGNEILSNLTSLSVCRSGILPLSKEWLLLAHTSEQLHNSSVYRLLRLHVLSAWSTVIYWAAFYISGEIWRSFQLTVSDHHSISFQELILCDLWPAVQLCLTCSYQTKQSKRPNRWLDTNHWKMLRIYK